MIDTVKRVAVAAGPVHK